MIRDNLNVNEIRYKQDCGHDISSIELKVNHYLEVEAFDFFLCVPQVGKCKSCRRICTINKIFDIFRTIECLSARYS